MRLGTIQIFILSAFTVLGCKGPSQEEPEQPKVVGSLDEPEVAEKTPTDDRSTESKTILEEKSPKKDEPKGPPIFEERQMIQLGEHQLTVVGSEFGWQSDNQFQQPKAGNTFLTIEVLLENKGVDPIAYNQFDFTLQDADGYTYRPEGGRKPNFGSGHLQQGRKVRGHIVFEVLETAHTFEVIFQPNWIRAAQIIVQVRAGRLVCESFDNCRLACPQGTTPQKKTTKDGGGENYCEKGGSLQGPYVSWQGNGQKEGETTFVDGKPHGSFILYHENGQKKLEGEFRNGERTGKMMLWYESGKKQGEMEFQGEEGQSVTWYESGQKKAEGRVLLETSTGCDAFKCWDEAGQPSPCNIEEPFYEGCKRTSTGADCPPCR